MFWLAVSNVREFRTGRRGVRLQPRSLVPPGAAAGNGVLENPEVRFRVVGRVGADPRECPGEATSSVDSAAITHVATDSSLGEFDVDLTLDPPDQDATLGTTTVG
jgi:hypothetical protein